MDLFVGEVMQQRHSFTQICPCFTRLSLGCLISLQIELVVIWDILHSMCVLTTNYVQQRMSGTVLSMFLTYSKSLWLSSKQPSVADHFVTFHLASISKQIIIACPGKLLPQTDSAVRDLFVQTFWENRQKSVWRNCTFWPFYAECML